jgi:hypothetical protein
MKNRLGLIQLLGEETMPGVLPMLSFRATGVTHIVSRSFERHVVHVLRAAELGQAAPPLAERSVLVLSEMPSMAETHQAVNEAIAAFQRKGMRPIVNFTGGTKLMSIGAFRAASAAAVASFYVDGDHGLFSDGQTGPDLHEILPGSLDLRTLTGRLSVRLLTTAHGCEMKGKGHGFARLLPLSRYLLEHPDEEEAMWNATYGPGGAFTDLERGSRDPGRWGRVAQIPFILPPAVLELASQAGLVEQSNGAALICWDDSAALGALQRGQVSSFDRMRLIAEIQRRVSFFGGAWWEVAVAGAVADSNKFRDVVWGALVAKQGQQTLEEDLLAVQDINLSYFSCKRGGPVRLMRQLEETDASARRLGGRMARKYFCVARLGDRMRGDLLRRAQQLRVHVITPAELKDFSAFLNREFRQDDQGPPLSAGIN